jgi:hypothetical protein
MHKICLIIFCLFIAKSVVAQKTELPDFYIIDTISIGNPVALYFKSKRHKGIAIIVSKDELDKVGRNKLRRGHVFLRNNGYYGVSPFEFKKYITKHVHFGNALIRDSLKTRLLIKDIWHYENGGLKSECEQPTEIVYNKYRRKVELTNISCDKFVFLLVKTTTLNSWTDRSDYKFKEVDNLYIPFVIMAPWIKDVPD